MLSKTLRRIWFMIFLFVFYVVFLQKEVILQSHSPHSNRHIEAIQYGTGIGDWKTIRIVYLDGDEVIAKKTFALLRETGRLSGTSVSWFEREYTGTEIVEIHGVYPTSFLPDMDDAEMRRMEFNYGSLESEITVSPTTFSS